MPCLRVAFVDDAGERTTARVLHNVRGGELVAAAAQNHFGYDFLLL
jgi:hypothetical protein